MAGEDKVHSALGASGAERWTNCPGSVSLCAGLPDRDTAAAYRGSAMHALVDRCILAGVEPSLFEGKALAEWSSYTFKEDDIEAVTVSLQFIREHSVRGADWGVEQQFALADFDAELFGTNDYWQYDKASAVLTVADHKFGFGSVEAADNMQLRFYALGALMLLGDRPVSSVETYIIQPADKATPIKRADYEPGDLLDFGGFLAERAAATRKPDAPLRSGKWCKFCKAAAICPRLAADAQAVAGADFADTLEPDAPGLLSADEMGDRLVRAGILKTWLDQITALAHDEARAGRLPAGFKWVNTRMGHRKFKDGALAMRQASRLLNLAEDELFERKPLSPAKFEKVAKKTASPETISTFVGAYLAPRKQGLALVPASDERPAVNPSPDADFSDAGDDE